MRGSFGVWVAVWLATGEFGLRLLYRLMWLGIGFRV